jgi:hypothetical protein
LIGDQDVLNTTNLAFQAIQDVIAQESSSSKRRGGNWQKNFFDIGILRVPTIECPSIRVNELSI